MSTARDIALTDNFGLFVPLAQPIGRTSEGYG